MTIGADSGERAVPRPGPFQGPAWPGVAGARLSPSYLSDSLIPVEQGLLRGPGDQRKCLKPRLTSLRRLAARARGRPGRRHPLQDTDVVEARRRGGRPSGTGDRVAEPCWTVESCRVAGFPVPCTSTHMTLVVGSIRNAVSVVAIRSRPVCPSYLPNDFTTRPRAVVYSPK